MYNVMLPESATRRTLPIFRLGRELKHDFRAIILGAVMYEPLRLEVSLSRRADAQWESGYGEQFYGALGRCVMAQYPEVVECQIRGAGEGSYYWVRPMPQNTPAPDPGHVPTT